MRRQHPSCNHYLYLTMSLLLFAAFFCHVTALENYPDSAYAPYPDETIYTYDVEEGSTSADYTDDEDLDYFETYGSIQYNDDDAVFKNNEKSRTSVSKSNWFSCDKNLRITKDKLCDGIRDCFDCSDEINCSASAVEDFVFCYGKEIDDHAASNYSAKTFSANDPKCIPRYMFCDGKQDCASGVDEKRIGYGFKCAVRRSHRTCLLVDEMIRDNTVDCKDLSDALISPDVEILASHFNTTPGTFICLNDKSKVSIFQNQVCDGVIDCPDLSDECLCNRPASSEIEEICNSICLHSVWLNSRPLNRNCKNCEPGNISTIFSTDALDFSGVEPIGITNHEIPQCIAPHEICVKDNLDNYFSNTCSKTYKEKIYNSTNCVSIDGTFEIIPARMCDGNPECFFGEDECVEECLEKSANKSFSNNFCQLLSPNYGYSCNNQSDNKDYEIMQAMRPCDCVIDCENAEDEALCPISCNLDLVPSDMTVGDVSHNFTNITAKSGSSYNNNQLESESRPTWGGKTICTGSVKHIEDDIFVSEHISQSPLEQVLRYGLLVLAAIGSIGNLFGLIISLVNSYGVIHSRDKDYVLRQHAHLFIQESVVYFSITLSKMMFCICLARQLIHEEKGVFLYGESAPWRTHSSCQSIGPLLMIFANFAWNAILLYLIIILVLKCVSRQTFSENICKIFNCFESNGSKVKNLVLSYLIILTLLCIVWIPMIIVVLVVQNLVEPCALVTFKNANNILSGFIDKSNASILADKIVTLSQSLPQSTPMLFSWEQFKQVISTAGMSLGVQVIGTAGYYSYSKICMPYMLSQPAKNSDFITDYQRFSSIFMTVETVIALCAVTTSIGLYVCSRMHTKRENLVNVNNDVPKDYQKLDVSIHRLFCLCMAEFITWFPIYVMYFVSHLYVVSEESYERVTLCLLSINYGLVSVYLLTCQRTLYCRKRHSTKQENNRESNGAFRSNQDTFDSDVREPIKSKDSVNT